MLSEDKNNGRGQRPQREEGDYRLEYIIKNWTKLQMDSREWLFFCAWRSSIKRRETLVKTPQFYSVWEKINSQ